MAARIAQAIVGAASRGRLSVLIFHRVPAAPDQLLPGEPDAASFESTMRWVRDVFNVMPLADGIAALKSGGLPPRALAITFDDGYANNATVAAPILRRLGMHATFFIATGYLDGGLMFNDVVIEAVRGCRRDSLDLTELGLGIHSMATLESRRHAVDAILAGVKYQPDGARQRTADRVAELAGVELPHDLMMASEQAAQLARDGFELGAHTVSHPILARLTPERARAEIADGRARVAELAGRRVGLFAYPNGRPHRDYVRASALLVQELGFDGAVSTSIGAARVGSDPFQVPRFTPWSVNPAAFARQMALNAARSRPDYVLA